MQHALNIYLSLDRSNVPANLHRYTIGEMQQQQRQQREAELLLSMATTLNVSVPAVRRMCESPERKAIRLRDELAHLRRRRHRLLSSRGESLSRLKETTRRLETETRAACDDVTLSRVVSAIGLDRLREVFDDPELRRWLRLYNRGNTAEHGNPALFFERVVGLSGAEYGILSTYFYKFSLGGGLTVYDALNAMSGICRYVDRRGA